MVQRWLDNFVGLDSRLAVVIVLVTVFIPFCGVLAYRRCVARRMGASMGWSLPPLLLLGILIVGPGIGVARAYFEWVACESARDQPIWANNGSRPPSEYLSDELIKEAINVVEEILLAPELPNNAWVAPRVRRVKLVLERLPEWIEQMEHVPDITARHFGPNVSRTGRVAEASHRSSKKICLYVDRLKLQFAHFGLDKRTEQATCLAFTLIHELCHLPAACGGFLEQAVPGEVLGQEPPLEHIGLYRWIADIACWYSLREEASGDHVTGAQACLATHRAILAPGTGAYGRALERHRMAGNVVQGPSGPLRWFADGPSGSACE